MDEVPEVTGFLVQEMEDRNGSDERRERPLSMAWITADLLAKTQRVWSKAYRRSVDENEAIEILMNVKQLAEVLLKAKQEVKKE